MVANKAFDRGDIFRGAMRELEADGVPRRFKRHDVQGRGPDDVRVDGYLGTGKGDREFDFGAFSEKRAGGDGRTLLVDIQGFAAELGEADAFDDHGELDSDAF